jgi:periplasmic protein TonB
MRPVNPVLNLIPARLTQAAQGLAVALLAGCASSPMPTYSPPPAQVPAPTSSVTPRNVEPLPTLPPPAILSRAATPREYRRDAAGHLYERNSTRIFKGKLPPLLYAVGVFEVEVDGRGQVVSTSWLRAPSHAPEVMREIERTVRAAAPYPAPTRMGKVTYTDTWLWDQSGRFQLDTLTEGQL